MSSAHEADALTTVDLRVPLLSRRLSLRRPDVSEAIASLPDRDRRLLVLMYVNGESPGGAAARLGIPRDGANRAAARATAKLAKRLRERLRGKTESRP